MGGRVRTILFVAVALTAIAAGIYGAFTNAVVDGFTAPLVGLPCYVLLITGCMILLSTALLRQAGWAKRMLFVTVSVALILVVTPFSRLLMLYNYPGDRIHFLRELPQYSQHVESLPHNGRRFAEFNWGGMLFASTGITYDETDEIAFPFGRQSAQWRARMKSTDLTCGGDGPVGMVESMGGHYYLTTFGC